MTTKLAELAPGTKGIRLKNGVIAQVGLFTLEHVIWAEEKYGSFEAMMMGTKGRTTRELYEMIYKIVENKDEVGTFDDFLRLTPVIELSNDKAVEMLVAAVGMSMPKPTKGGAGAQSGKSTGGTASPQSRGTTRTSSTRS